MVKAFPELKKIKFPGKTYFSWLGKNNSQLSESVVAERKEAIEKFFHHIFLCKYHEKFQELKNFISSTNFHYSNSFA